MIGFLATVGIAGNACNKAPAEKRESTSAVAVSSSSAPLPAPTNPERDVVFTPPFEASPIAKRGAPIHVAFDWSPPCRVPVVYDFERDGHKMRARMTVALDRADASIDLRILDPLVLLIDGQDATRPDLARALAPIAAFVTLIPSATIAPNGEILSVEEGYAEQVATRLARSDVPELAQLAPAARLPVMKAAMEQSVRTLWGNWVETWLAFELAPGSSRKFMAQAPFLGHSLTWPSRIEHRGPVGDAPDLALLSREETFEGKAAEAVFGTVGDELMAQADAEALPADAMAGLKVVRRNIVAIEPGRARPHRARYEVRTSLGNLERSEVRETMFDWDHAVGCHR